jgi:hypothetical protein
VALESLSERIREYNDRIETLAQQSYPQVALLKQIKGVGTLIALTLPADAGRSAPFSQDRDGGCDLGLQPGPEAGRARREEREEASDHCHRAKAGGVAASSLGKRRSVRAVAQLQSDGNAGNSVKQNRSPKGKTKSPKRRVPVTASMAWPNFHPGDETGGRQSGGSTGCKRERPTCTERTIAH